MRRTGQKSIIRFIAVAVTAGLGLASLQGLTPAAASSAPQPGPTYAQPGVTYVGYPTNRVGNGFPSIGGRIEVTVSADGRSVTRFAAIDVPYPANPANAACLGSTFSYTFTGNVPITTPPGYPDNFYFVDTSPLSAPDLRPLDFDGNFDPGTVTGRFSYEEPGWDADPFNKCNTQGNLGWTASAPGGCTGSPEYVELKAQVDVLTKQMKKLLKKVKKAKKAGQRDKAAKLRRKFKKLKGERNRLQDRLDPMCHTVGP